MPAGSVFRIKSLLAGSLKGTGKKEWPDGTPGGTKLVPQKFKPSSSSNGSSSSSSQVLESTAGIQRETPSSFAVADVVATLDTCIVLDRPAKPFFWLPPVPR